MRRTLALFATILLTLGVHLAAVEDADARRLGGGRSLGNRSALQRAAPAPRTPAQQKAFTQNQQARQQLAQRGGLTGVLGGLAIGGLLGALFFGGAFENVNLLDVLLFAGLAWIAFRLLAARHRAAPAGAFPQPAQDSGAPAGDALRFGLRDGTQRPADFDERAFLDGARRAFDVLQKRWNESDLGEIRALTTDAMFADLQDLLREPGTRSFVQVLEVDARLLDVRERDGVQEAAVLFDSVLREAEDERPSQAREIWHFTRPAGSRAPTWFLDAIEQLQD